MHHHATKLIGKPCRLTHRNQYGFLLAEPGDPLDSWALGEIIKAGSYHKELEAHGILSDRHDPVAVYVPLDATGPNTMAIRPRSAIIGKFTGPLHDRIHLYYQDIGGSDNIRTYADALVHAEGRMRRSYPTIATCFCCLEDVINVGIWDGIRFHVLDEEHLKRWTGWEFLPERELNRSDRSLP